MPFRIPAPLRLAATSIRPVAGSSRNTLNWIFFSSGAAALIFESVWARYIGTVFGHAALAQAIVLGLFMGGMAIGAAIASSLAAKFTLPLHSYALLEGAIGILALLFHNAFVAATALLDTPELHAMTSQWPSGAEKFLLAGVLILPQSILAGATFPFCATIAARRADANPGKSVATAYFANSAGGAVGVLLSGFVLVPTVGLPGAMIGGGLINLAVAIAAWGVSLVLAAPAAGEMSRRASPPTISGTVLLIVSCLTGASSFIYEIAWTRMFALTFGSATHSFEIMLAVFISGLAFGGLFIRKRVDAHPAPERLLGTIQVLMGLAALATIPLHTASFDAAAAVIGALPRNDHGYALWNLSRLLICTVIMFPATFCAGMTLPLIAQRLAQHRHIGLRGYGQAYAANTAGAILGLVVAIFIGFPYLGPTGLVAAGATLDLLLGVWLLTLADKRPAAFAALCTTACMVLIALAISSADPARLVSGVYRTGKARSENTLVEVAHGRSATVSVEKSATALIIKTNGKPDSSAAIEPAKGYEIDEVTATLISTIPQMLHADPKRVAQIGIGAGITSQSILEDPRVAGLDTIEIEPEMARLARTFGERNQRLFSDPRSHIHFEDAKTFFSWRRGQYDLIISEPSNPWVSGVAGLYSVDFHRRLASSLAADGLLAQWVQVYEIDPKRVVSILKAIDTVFEDYVVFAVDYGDILIVARPRGAIRIDATSYARLAPAALDRLRRLDIIGPSDILLRIVGTRSSMHNWLTNQAEPAHADFYPYLDVHADRDRFLRIGWPDFQSMQFTGDPVAAALGRPVELPSANVIGRDRHFGAGRPPVGFQLYNPVR